MRNQVVHSASGLCIVSTYSTFARKDTRLEVISSLVFFISKESHRPFRLTKTVIFLFLAAEPMLEKLDRIKVKYGLVE